MPAVSHCSETHSSVFVGVRQCQCLVYRPGNNKRKITALKHDADLNGSNSDLTYLNKVFTFRI